MNPRWGNWDTKMWTYVPQIMKEVIPSTQNSTSLLFSEFCRWRQSPAGFPGREKASIRNGSSLHCPHIHLYLQSQMVTCWHSQLVTGKARGQNEGLLFKCYSMAISDSDTLIAQKGLLLFVCLFVCFLFLFSSIGDVMNSDEAVM
jgi:hypothetical protein